MECAGESGVHLSVGAENKAYGDQAAAACKLFFCKSGEETSRRPGNHQYNHTIGKVKRHFDIYFSSFDKFTDIMRYIHTPPLIIGPCSYMDLYLFLFLCVSIFDTEPHLPVLLDTESSGH